MNRKQFFSNLLAASKVKMPDASKLKLLRDIQKNLITAAPIDPLYEQWINTHHAKVVMYQIEYELDNNRNA